MVTVAADVVIERETWPSISRYRGRPMMDANWVTVDPNDALNKSLYASSTPPTPRDGARRVKLFTAVGPGVLAPAGGGLNNRIASNVATPSDVDAVVTPPSVDPVARGSSEASTDVTVTACEDSSNACARFPAASTTYTVTRARSTSSSAGIVERSLGTASKPAGAPGTTENRNSLVRSSATHVAPVQSLAATTTTYSPMGNGALNTNRNVASPSTVVTTDDGVVDIVTPPASAERATSSVASIVNPRASGATFPLSSTKRAVVGSSVIVDAPTSLVDAYAACVRSTRSCVVSTPLGAP